MSKANLTKGVYSTVILILVIAIAAIPIRTVSADGGKPPSVDVNAIAQLSAKLVSLGPNERATLWGQLTPEQQHNVVLYNTIARTESRTTVSTNRASSLALPGVQPLTGGSTGRYDEQVTYSILGPWLYKIWQQVNWGYTGASLLWQNRSYGTATAPGSFWYFTGNYCVNFTTGGAPGWSYQADVSMQFRNDLIGQYGQSRINTTARGDGTSSVVKWNGC